MTVVSSGSTITFAGDGVQTFFDFNFRVFREDDLSAVVRRADGEESGLVLGSDFKIISGIGDDGGGRVQYPVSGDPLFAGESLTLFRDIEYSQELELVDNDPFSASLLNEAFDRGVMRDQQLQEQVDRSLKYEISTPKNEQLSAKDFITDITDSCAASVAAMDAARTAQAAAEDAQLSSETAQSNAQAALSSAQTAEAGAQTAQGAAETALDATLAAQAVAEGEVAAIPGLIDTEKSVAVAAVSEQQMASIAAVSSQEGVSIAAVAVQESSSVAAVSAQQVSSAATVQSTGQAELDKLTALVPAVFDQESFFNDQLAKLVSGEALGTEGRWKVVLEGSITLDGYFLQSVLGTSRTLLSDSTISYDSVVGSSSSLDVTSYGVVWGDSGEPYLVHHVAYASVDSAVRNCALNPKIGDVRWDFTIGNSYPVMVFKESTESADQQAGTLDVTDIVLGKRRYVEDIWTTEVRTTIDPEYPDPYWYNNNTAAINISGQTITVTGAVDHNYVQLRKAAPFDLVKFKVTNNGTDVVTVTGGQSVPSPFLNPGQSAEFFVSSGRYDLATLSAATGSDLNVTIDYITEAVGTQWSQAELAEIMPVDSLATLNAGYFAGKTWMSQALSDCTLYDTGTADARVSIKMSRPALTNLNHSVRVRKADGTWSTFTLGSGTNPFEYQFFFDLNIAVINIGASFAALGYASEADMLINAVIEIKFETTARRLRPIDNPSDVKLLGDVWLLWHPSNSFGRLLAWELNNYVHVASPSGSPKVRPIVGTLISPTVNRYDARFYTPEFNLPALPDSSLTMLVCGLCSINGTYHIIFWSKELIYDADYGDSRELAIVNQRLTELDENGNVVYTGCMSYDTGIAIAA